MAARHQPPTATRALCANQPSEDEPPLDDEAVAEVEHLTHAPDHPVTMFALEWCEFCWSVRKVFRAYGIDYQSADLDAVDYQENDWGARLRVALREKTGWNTFPQIFIKGEFIGGCTDLFDGIKDGSVLQKLGERDIPYHPDVDIDPYSLLPGWLHPR